MFGVAEFAVRMLLRYGALAGFLALAALSVAAFIMLARNGFRPPIWSLCALAGLIGAALLAAPAWQGVRGAGQAVAALNRAPPAPSGPFDVGAATLRLEPLARDRGAPISVRVWFPQNDAPVEMRRLILYAPGIGGDRTQNELTVANLASYGYVVVGFDDLSYEPAPAEETPEQRAIREGRMDFSTPEALAQTVRDADQRVETQSSKAIDILNRFAALTNDAETPWGGRVDVDRVGFLGYSFGGATAAETAQRDQRIVATVNIDGTLFGQAGEAGVCTPYLLIMGDMRELSHIPRTLRRSLEYQLNDRDLARGRMQAARKDNDVIEVRFAGHAAFADAYFNRSNFTSWLKLDPFRAYDVVQSRVIPFFKRHLPIADAPPAPKRPRHFDEVLEVGA